MEAVAQTLHLAQQEILHVQHELLVLRGAAGQTSVSPTRRGDSPQRSAANGLLPASPPTTEPVSSTPLPATSPTAAMPGVNGHTVAPNAAGAMQVHDAIQQRQEKAVQLLQHGAHQLLELIRPDSIFRTHGSPPHRAQTVEDHRATHRYVVAAGSSPRQNMVESVKTEPRDAETIRSSWRQDWPLAHQEPVELRSSSAPKQPWESRHPSPRLAAISPSRAALGLAAPDRSPQLPQHRDHSESGRRTAAVHSSRTASGRSSQAESAAENRYAAEVAMRERLKVADRHALIYSTLFRWAVLHTRSTAKARKNMQRYYDAKLKTTEQRYEEQLQNCEEEVYDAKRQVRRLADMVCAERQKIGLKDALCHWRRRAERQRVERAVTAAASAAHEQHVAALAACVASSAAARTKQRLLGRWYQLLLRRQSARTAAELAVSTASISSRDVEIQRLGESWGSRLEREREQGKVLAELASSERSALEAELTALKEELRTTREAFEQHVGQHVADHQMLTRRLAEHSQEHQLDLDQMRNRLELERAVFARESRQRLAEQREMVFIGWLPAQRNLEAQWLRAATQLYTQHVNCVWARELERQGAQVAAARAEALSAVAVLEPLHGEVSDLKGALARCQVELVKAQDDLERAQVMHQSDLEVLRQKRRRDAEEYDEVLERFRKEKRRQFNEMCSSLDYTLSHASNLLAVHAEQQLQRRYLMEWLRWTDRSRSQQVEATLRVELDKAHIALTEVAAAPDDGKADDGNHATQTSVEVHPTVDPSFHHECTKALEEALAQLSACEERNRVLQNALGAEQTQSDHLQRELDQLKQQLSVDNAHDREEAQRLAQRDASEAAELRAEQARLREALETAERRLEVATSQRREAEERVAELQAATESASADLEAQHERYERLQQRYVLVQELQDRCDLEYQEAYRRHHLVSYRFITSAMLDKMCARPKVTHDAATETSRSGDDVTAPPPQAGPIASLPPLGPSEEPGDAPNMNDVEFDPISTIPSPRSSASRSEPSAPREAAARQLVEESVPRTELAEALRKLGRAEQESRQAVSHIQYLGELLVEYCAKLYFTVWKATTLERRYRSRMEQLAREAQADQRAACDTIERLREQRDEYRREVRQQHHFLSDHIEHLPTRHLGTSLEVFSNFVAAKYNTYFTATGAVLDEQHERVLLEAFDERGRELQHRCNALEAEKNEVVAHAESLKELCESLNEKLSAATAEPRDELRAIAAEAQVEELLRQLEELRALHADECARAARDHEARLGAALELHGAELQAEADRKCEAAERLHRGTLEQERLSFATKLGDATRLWNEAQTEAQRLADQVKELRDESQREATASSERIAALEERCRSLETQLAGEQKHAAAASRARDTLEALHQEKEAEWVRLLHMHEVRALKAEQQDLQRSETIEQLRGMLEAAHDELNNLRLHSGHTAPPVTDAERQASGDAGPVATEVAAPPASNDAIVPAIPPEQVIRDVLSALVHEECAKQVWHSREAIDSMERAARLALDQQRVQYEAQLKKLLVYGRFLEGNLFRSQDALEVASGDVSSLSVQNHSAVADGGEASHDGASCWDLGGPPEAWRNDGLEPGGPVGRGEAAVSESADGGEAAASRPTDRWAGGSTPSVAIADPDGEPVHRTQDAVLSPADEIQQAMQGVISQYAGVLEDFQRYIAHRLESFYSVSGMLAEAEKFSRAMWRIYEGDLRQLEERSASLVPAARASVEAAAPAEETCSAGGAAPEPRDSGATSHPLGWTRVYRLKVRQLERQLTSLRGRRRLERRRVKRETRRLENRLAKASWLAAKRKEAVESIEAAVTASSHSITQWAEKFAPLNAYLISVCGEPNGVTGEVEARQEQLQSELQQALAELTDGVVELSQLASTAGSSSPTSTSAIHLSDSTASSDTSSLSQTALAYLREAVDGKGRAPGERRETSVSPSSERSASAAGGAKADIQPLHSSEVRGAGSVWSRGELSVSSITVSGPCSAAFTDDAGAPMEQQLQRLLQQYSAVLDSLQRYIAHRLESFYSVSGMLAEAEKFSQAMWRIYEGDLQRMRDARVQLAAEAPPAMRLETARAESPLDGVAAVPALASDDASPRGQSCLPQVDGPALTRPPASPPSTQRAHQLQLALEESTAKVEYWQQRFADLECSVAQQAAEAAEEEQMRRAADQETIAALEKSLVGVKVQLAELQQALDAGQRGFSAEAGGDPGGITPAADTAAVAELHRMYQGEIRDLQRQMRSERAAAARHLEEHTRELLETEALRQAKADAKAEDTIAGLRVQVQTLVEAVDKGAQEAKAEREWALQLEQESRAEAEAALYTEMVVLQTQLMEKDGEIAELRQQVEVLAGTVRELEALELEQAARSPTDDALHVATQTDEGHGGAGEGCSERGGDGAAMDGEGPAAEREVRRVVASYETQLSACRQEHEAALRRQQEEFDHYVEALQREKAELGDVVSELLAESGRIKEMLLLARQCSPPASPQGCVARSPSVPSPVAAGAEAGEAPRRRPGAGEEDPVLAVRTRLDFGAVSPPTSTPPMAATTDSPPHQPPHHHPHRSTSASRCTCSSSSSSSAEETDRGTCNPATGVASESPGAVLSVQRHDLTDSLGSSAGAHRRLVVTPLAQQYFRREPSLPLSPVARDTGDSAAGPLAVGESHGGATDVDRVGACGAQPLQTPPAQRLLLRLGARAPRGWHGDPVASDALTPRDHGTQGGSRCTTATSRSISPAEVTESLRRYSRHLNEQQCRNDQAASRSERLVNDVDDLIRHGKLLQRLMSDALAGERSPRPTPPRHTTSPTASGATLADPPHLHESYL